MGDLRPKGVIAMIAGKKVELLFTIGAIEEIQENCNAPLIDVVEKMAKVADGNTEIENIRALYTVIAAFSNKEGTGCEVKDIDGAIKPSEFSRLALKVIEAYGISMPEQPDEEDDDESEEDEDPNQKTGR